MTERERERTRYTEESERAKRKRNILVYLIRFSNHGTHSHKAMTTAYSYACIDVEHVRTTIPNSFAACDLSLLELTLS